MSKENFIKYKEIITEQMNRKREIVAQELKSCCNVPELYNSNNLLRIAKTLEIAAVEIARLEGELNVLNQLLGSEEE